ncbi:hypothetical protein EOI86_17575 [Hwanghaeella grinnelliae]|uniref:Uncharacterized protein n=1 Tax=Hwanghaeella grinnelliae TaxID=2500179 RepID=A0A3S2Z6X1_9PROT|nr:hypothetical protein [Hwanghaeella grinnelliae]RVU34667.1 hypothetical protein EOI86_17575 [Hwanghaeella grinnelliae]
MTELRTYTTLLTFERTSCVSEILPDHVQGACGYVAVAAADEDEVIEILQRGLEYVGLRFLETDQISEYFDDDSVQELDEHLFENLKVWEPGKRWVWGTIFCYLADGEA